MLLLSENREPEVSNHFREWSLEKEFGRETDNAEGNNENESEKDNSADFRHGVDHSSISVRY